MKRIIITSFLIGLNFVLFLSAQNVEVQGKLKVSNVLQNDTASQIVIRNSDGSLGKRNVATLGGGEAPGNAIGDMKYWNGTSWQILQAGSPASILKVSQNGVPKWQKLGSKTILITGNITNAQAQAKLEDEFGYNTDSIIVQNTTQLSSLDLSIVDVIPVLRIVYNDLLNNITINGLNTSATSITILSNPNLATINYISLVVNLGIITISNNVNLSSVLMPSFSENRRSFTLSMTSNINLPAFSINTGSLTFSGTSSTTLLLPSFINNHGSITIKQLNTSNLLTNLINNFGSISISDIPFATTLLIPALTSSSGSFSVTSTSITAISLPSLAMLSGVKFYCTDNIMLTDISLPSLISNKTDFRIWNNTSLINISLPALQTNTEVINFYQNANLSTLSFPSFISNTGSFNMNYNPKITSIAFPNLTTCSGIITCSNNVILNSLFVPNLSQVGSLFYCSLNPLLTDLSLPALTSYSGSTITLTNNKLSSNSINALLARFVALGTTPLNNIALQGQSPSAPPTGQGIVDKATLISNGKVVTTD